MLHFIHIPRTGGTARRFAMRDVMRMVPCPVKMSNHYAHVSDVAPEDTPVIFLRDPIDHFRSCWDHIAPLGGGYLKGSDFLKRWPRVEDVIENLDYIVNTYTKNRDIWMFQPYSRWVDVERPDALYGRTETLDADMRRILEPEGLSRHADRLPTGNDRAPSKQWTEFTAQQTMRLLEFYADDIAMVKRLAPR